MSDSAQCKVICPRGIRPLFVRLPGSRTAARLALIPRAAIVRGPPAVAAMAYQRRNKSLTRRPAVRCPSLLSPFGDSG